MKAEILNGPRIFASRFSIWSRAVNTMGSKDLRSLGQTSRSRNNSTSQLEDISHRDSNLSVGCIFTVVMIFCPFLGMKTTDDMGRFPKYIRKQRPKSNHTYLVLERMFSLATTLSILFFQEIKQDTREWIN